MPRGGVWAFPQKWREATEGLKQTVAGESGELLMLVDEGGPNKAPQTRGLKQQKLLSHGSGARRSKVKVPWGLRRTALLQAPLLGSWVPSLCSRGALLAYTPPVFKSLPPHPPFFW